MSYFIVQPLASASKSPLTTICSCCGSCRLRYGL